jgi:transcriptional/translational regulatory protein YebC/TACO1
MFERKSQIFVPGEKATEDQLMNIVLDAGADDLRGDGETWEILSAPEAHDAVLKALEASGLHPAEAAIVMVPKNVIKLVGKSASNMMRLSEALEEHDDVQSVYSNFEIDDEEMEALAQ